MENRQVLFEFKADFIIKATMYLHDKTEVTYNEINNTIKDLRKIVTKKGDRCLILFSNEYLKEVKQDHDDMFYVGKNFIALNENYDLDNLLEDFFGYMSPDKLMFLLEMKENKSHKNEKTF